MSLSCRIANSQSQCAWMCSACPPSSMASLAGSQPLEASVAQNAQLSPLGTHAHSARSRIAFFIVVSAPARFTRRSTEPDKSSVFDEYEEIP